MPSGRHAVRPGGRGGLPRDPRFHLPGAPRRPLMNRTILIVDDDAGIRRLIATTLEDVSGYRMSKAGDGEEAMRRAREVQPSIVFLDIDMPRLDGIEACRRLKSEPSTADATIVMLTGDAEQGAELEARRAGADLFLTKPFSPLHLLRLVDRLADRPPQR